MLESTMASRQTTPRRRMTLAVFGAVFPTLLTAPARAEIEEVTVTARKWVEPMNEVGLSLSVMTASDIRERGLTDLTRLAAGIPNVQSYLPNTALQSLHVRGIGLNEFQGQYDSPVAVHHDEVYLSKPWMTSRAPFDIERIEVLRGPQDTVFGRNTTGGAVNYYTRAPSERREAFIEADIDSFGRAAQVAVVGGALRGDLAGRLSIYNRVGIGGGIQRNLYDGKRTGDPDTREVRAQLAFAGEATRIRALGHWGINRGETQAWKSPGLFAPDGSYCDAALTGATLKQRDACLKFAGFAALAGFPEAETEPVDRDTVNTDIPPKLHDEFAGGLLRIEHDFAAATLTSLTAYEHYRRSQHEDSDSSPIVSTSTHYASRIRQFNQELRLSGDFHDSWRYLAGAFFEHDDLAAFDGSNLSENYFLLGIGAIPAFAPYLFTDFSEDVDSAAVFARTEFELTDEFAIEAGLRYTRDHIEYRGLTALGLNDPQGRDQRVTPCLITTDPLATAIAAPACPFLGPLAPDGGMRRDAHTDRDLAWLIGARWRPGEGTLIYANLTTGYHGGGYSSPFGAAVTEFDDEQVLAAEVGAKLRLPNDRGQLNLAAFHYDYDDMQVNVDDPVSMLVPITRNVGKARYRGIESELTLAFGERWSAILTGGYLDARYTKTDRTITVYGNPRIAIPLQSKQPVNAPKWTASGLVRYQRPVTPGWNLALSAHLNWVAERFLEATNQPFDRAAPYAVVNARAALIRADSRLEFAIHGYNLFDASYLTYINNIASFALNAWGEPAHFGGYVRYAIE